MLSQPTSGLESYSAMQLIKVLKKVAKAESSVLSTIHQPISDVFNSFNQIILMNSGQVMASGSVDSMASCSEQL
jgi:ABC-type multidrug transport system ATPase subunit